MHDAHLTKSRQGDWQVHYNTKIQQDSTHFIACCNREDMSFLRDVTDNIVYVCTVQVEWSMHVITDRETLITKTLTHINSNW